MNEIPNTFKKHTSNYNLRNLLTDYLLYTHPWMNILDVLSTLVRKCVTTLQRS